jgi:DMSO/TMAO reductase YedYZ molybdopterin-dependent catalytic subunit
LATATNARDGRYVIVAATAKPVGTLIRIISVPADPTQPSHAPRRNLRVGLGAALGITTALLALGIAQLVAALFNSQVGGPVDAVGELSIDHTPAPVKNFAIREFGSNDKTVLVWGIRAVLIIFAIAIGILALRKLWYGMVGLAIFIAIGIAAAESQPNSKPSDVFPALIGGVLGALFMRRVARLVSQPEPRYAAPPRARPAGPAGGQPWKPAADDMLPPGTRTESWAESPPGPAEQEPPAPSGPGPAGPEPRAPSSPGLPAGPVGPYIPQAGDDGDDWTPESPARPVPAGSAGGTGPGAAGQWHSSWPPQPGRQDRPSYQNQQGPDRRRFLLMSGAAGVGGLLVYGAGSWLANTRDVSDVQQALKLPRATVKAAPLPAGADLKIPGLSSFITPNSNFYRVDTAIVLPEILPANWQLRVHGMVQRELTLSFKDLIKRPLIEDYITLCCVSNPVGGPYIGNAKWLGASLRSLLQEAGIKAGANQLLATSSDGFTSGSPVEIAMDGRDALLAVAMNDKALPVEHGFPVRQVIPGLYGYVSACKWIVDIEVTTYAAAQAYWVPRGWSPQGPIKTESRIDVPTNGATIKAGTSTAIAGEAWAQHKGIEAVEVRIGNGAWHPAQLAPVPDLDTWRQWVYHWDASVPKGTYVIEARATDKTGYTQTSLQVPEAPNGASGYPSIQVVVN